MAIVIRKRQGVKAAEVVHSSCGKTDEQSDERQLSAAISRNALIGLARELAKRHAREDYARVFQGSSS